MPWHRRDGDAEPSVRIRLEVALEFLASFGDESHGRHESLAHGPQATAAVLSTIRGRAEIIVPIGAIETADGDPLSFAAAQRFFSKVDAYPAKVEPAPRVSLTLDRFVYELHLGDVAHQSETHDGDAFVEAAVADGHVTVLVADQVDPRRSKLEEIDTAAGEGLVVGGSVTVFVIDVITG